jgi:hypothetical protein
MLVTEERMIARLVAAAAALSVTLSLVWGIAPLVLAQACR